MVYKPSARGLIYKIISILVLCEIWDPIRIYYIGMKSRKITDFLRVDNGIHPLFYSYYLISKYGTIIL